jgi:hypothetical protein
VGAVLPVGVVSVALSFLPGRVRNDTKPSAATTKRSAIAAATTTILIYTNPFFVTFFCIGHKYIKVQDDFYDYDIESEGRHYD